MFSTAGKIASLLVTATSGSADLDPYLLVLGLVIAGLSFWVIRVRFAARFGAAFACVVAVFAIMHGAWDQW